MFMHNGAIANSRRTSMRTLRDPLGDEAYSGLLGATDPETIFAGLLDLLAEDPTGLASATRETTHHVREVCDGLGVRARLNLAVTDGAAMVSTRYSTEGPGNSL